jgi:hypothetical protein
MVRWLDVPEWVRASALFGIACACGLTFLGMSALLGSRELRELRQAVQKRGKQATRGG